VVFPYLFPKAGGDAQTALIVEVVMKNTAKQ
jgi:hypothetical protein